MPQNNISKYLEDQRSYSITLQFEFVGKRLTLLLPPKWRNMCIRKTMMLTKLLINRISQRNHLSIIISNIHFLGKVVLFSLEELCLFSFSLGLDTLVTRLCKISCLLIRYCENISFLWIVLLRCSIHNCFTTGYEYILRSI